jgi:hypothetical protein
MPTSINGKKKDKEKTSHGMTRKNTEGRIERRTRESISHGKTRNQISSGGGWKPSERSERALFPEGRGLGVGRKKEKESKREKGKK